MEIQFATALLLLRVILVSALFGFLVWAFRMVWQDISGTEKTQRVEEIQRIRLSAAQPGEEKGFTQSEINVGRLASNDWVLDDETVSGRHARLNFHDGHWWLQDLTSRNGTFLAGQKISEAVVLSDGDEISCGRFRFVFKIGEDV